MKTQNYRYLLCMAVACLPPAPMPEGKRVRGRVATVLPSESNEVTVKSEAGDLEHELVSNGKVTAGAWRICVLRPPV